MDELIQFLAIKLHQGLMFIDGMVTSIVVIVYSKTNFVKFIRITCCSENHWCCARTHIARSSCDLEWDWTTLGINKTFQYAHLNLRKIVRIGSHTISQSLKKGLCQNNTIKVIRNTSLHSDESWIQVFEHKSERMHGYFKIIWIQQKLFWHGALTSQCLPVFSEKKSTYRNLTTRLT